MKSGVLVLRKILIIISLASACLFAISTIDCYLLDPYSAFHIFPWYKERTGNMTNLSLYINGLPLFICIGTGFIAFVLTRIIVPTSKTSSYFTPLIGPLISIFLFAPLPSLLPISPSTVQLVRETILFGEITRMKQSPKEKRDYYLEKWCKRDFLNAPFSKKYLPTLSSEEQEILIKEIEEWFHTNKNYLFYNKGTYIIDQEAKAAGIPTEEYRKTHPWPKDKEPDKPDGSKQK